MTETKKSIKAQDSDGNVLYFKSKYAAGKHCGCSAAMIHLVCIGKSKDFQGVVFTLCDLPEEAKHTTLPNQKHKKTLDKYGTEEAWQEEKARRNKIYFKRFQNKKKGLSSDDEDIL